jgi:hypothetical protein
VKYDIELFSENISPKNYSKEAKNVSLHPFFAFRLYNLKIAGIFTTRK